MLKGLNAALTDAALSVAVKSAALNGSK